MKPGSGPTGKSQHNRHAESTMDPLAAQHRSRNSALTDKSGLLAGSGSQRTSKVCTKSRQALSMVYLDKQTTEGLARTMAAAVPAKADTSQKAAAAVACPDTCCCY